MTGRELVKSSLNFAGVDRLPYDFDSVHGVHGSDFLWVNGEPHPDPLGNPDLTRKSWTDEWGCCWERLGNTLLGEVKNIVLTDYAQVAQLPFPDLSDAARWEKARADIAANHDQFVLGGGGSLYFRATFLRGIDNIWMDIYDDPEGLCALVDRLCEFNMALVDVFHAIGADGIIFSDDWGLQNTLQISPEKWREIWKPRYDRLFGYARRKGLCVFLHSCGYIVDILDDLIDAGLQAIHMDQQENMGLALLGKRFGGRINFFAPVDIQQTMIQGSDDDIRAYCREMMAHLHTADGGLIPRWYTDPEGAGHRQAAIDVMCREFLAISQERYGK